MVTNAIGLKQDLQLNLLQAGMKRGGGQVALLSECPHCGHYAVSIHFDRTVENCVRRGSQKAPLRLKCSHCPATFRLHSFKQSNVLAEVDASRHRQVSAMKSVAEDLNWYAPEASTGGFGTKKCQQKECRSLYNVQGLPVHHAQCVNKHYRLELGEVKNWTEKELKNKLAMPIKRWEKRLRGGY